MHYLVADIARNITLVPGDILLSGTPANSRTVYPGDVVTVEVEGLGALTNTIVTGPPRPIRADVGAQPSSSEEVMSTAQGGDWEFRGIRPPSEGRRLTVRADARTSPAFRYPVDHWIGGAWVGSADTFETRSPLAVGRAPGRRCAWRCRHGRSRGSYAAAGRRLRDLWGAMSPSRTGPDLAPPGRSHRSQRRRHCRRSKPWTWPSSKSPCEPASLVEAHSTSGSTPTWLVEHEDRTWDAKDMWNTVQRMPAGPAVVITPWNAPFMLSTWKLAPALAGGVTR